MLSNSYLPCHDRKGKRLLHSLALMVMKTCQAEHVSTGHRHPWRFGEMAKWVYPFIRQEVRQQLQGSELARQRKQKAPSPSSLPSRLALIRTMWAKSCVAFEGTELKLLGLRAWSISFVLLLLMPLSPQCRSARQS